VANRELNLVEMTDRSFGVERTAVSCRECDALEDVFDRLRPNGLRYGINSAAMRFIQVVSQ
jgi:peptide-methionine (R)-S-oxide reductase